MSLVLTAKALERVFLVFVATKIFESGIIVDLKRCKM